MYILKQGSFCLYLSVIMELVVVSYIKNSVVIAVIKWDPVAGAWEALSGWDGLSSWLQIIAIVVFLVALLSAALL